MHAVRQLNTEKTIAFDSRLKVLPAEVACPSLQAEGGRKVIYSESGGLIRQVER